MNRTKKFSAVVPSLNNKETIARCLKSVLSNGPDEIIIVDGGSNDTTLEIASRFPSTKILREVKGISKAKDVGWRTSIGDLVLFIDADAYIESTTVNMLQEHLSSSDIAGVSCRVACANTDQLLPRLRDFDFHLTYEEQFRDSDVIDCVADPTICGLFKRKALEAVDGFDLEYPYAEDLRLLQKFRNRGYRVLMVHEPGVYHYHRENYRDVYRQAYNHGVGRRMFMDQTKGRFYSKKDPIRFAILALRNGTKAGLGVLLIYPFYRAFTEAAFLMGYLSGERNFKSDRAPQRRTDKDLEVDLVGSGPTEVQA